MKPRMKIMRAAVLISFIMLSSLFAQTTKPSDRWTPLAFLIGEWAGVGGGGPGQGSGGFSFLPDQNGTVLVRKNRADYAASKERPAFSHTDLMIVYQEDAKFRAIYFDTEDHVIHYDVEVGGESVRFLNKDYRLTYSKTGADTVSIKFEIADQAGNFKTYIEATARRLSTQ